jgi:chromosome partitioning protein
MSSNPNPLVSFATLIVGNSKGGVGKSLLSTCLAAAFAETGAKVFLIDADVGQDTAQDWINRRPLGRVAGCKSALADIGRTIARAREKGADMVIVDLGGRDDAGLKRVLEQADLVLVPAQPSMPDLQATNRFTRIAKAAGVPWTVVLTRVKREESSRTREYVDQYAAVGKIAPVHTGDRVSYQDAFLHAQGVTEFAPQSIAAWEVNRLRDHIIERLTDGI